MTIEQIKEAINEIQHEIFIHSLVRKPMGQLLSLSERVELLREEFMHCCFLGQDVEDIEGIRFQLEESRLNLEIQMKELQGKDVTRGMEQLRNLYQPTY